ncbi:MAG: DUF2304 domain-containing protein [Candidatus Omnitrophota bacterium]
MIRLRITAGICSLFFLTVIFEAIRRRKLMEKHALLWIFCGILVFALSIFPEPLIRLSEALGINYLPILLLFSFIFLLLIVLYFSIALSRLSEKNRELAQEIGILKLKLSNTEKKNKNG